MLLEIGDASAHIIMSSHNPLNLPDNLPIPVDDGACNHLEGMILPSVFLEATNGEKLNIAEISKQKTIFYFYPRTGIPGKNPPEGWNEIPGARGCTPQTCNFRGTYHEFKKLNVSIFGVSTQTTEYQAEAVSRLTLPFLMLSDKNLELSRYLQLPTFEVLGVTLIKRITLVADEGRIIKYFYPIFPPDKNADEVLKYLKS